MYTKYTNCTPRILILFLLEPFFKPLYSLFPVVDNALITLGKSKQTRKGSRETTSSVKRKASDENIENTEDEDKDREDKDVEDADDATNIVEAPTTPTSHQAYNTRFKGVKRVKMGREYPEGFPYATHRRNKASAATNLTSGSQTKTTDENGAGDGMVGSVKRPRGRPRKNTQIVSAHSSRPTTSTMKQVFDGVVVLKRARPPSKRAELQDPQGDRPDPDVDADVDAEGDVEGDSEEIVAPSHVESNGLIGVEGPNDHQDSNQGDSLCP
jgi:hypothetical protein